jgi:hypothetical protein
MMMRGVRAVAIVTVILAWAGAAGAQQRPLMTQDPECIGAGHILFETGIDYLRQESYPLSGLTGNLLKPVFGAMFGISSIAELQITGGPYNYLNITSRQPAPLSDQLEVSGTSTHDVEDIVIATKVRLVSESAARPAIGFRFATRLPNSKHRTGLGLDTTDFLASFLIGKTMQSVRIVGNVGLGILPAPLRPDLQNDVLTYGVSVARALVQGTEVVAEINGRRSTRDNNIYPGTEDHSLVRVGARYLRGGARVDGAVILGVTKQDPGFGFTVGLTYVFDGFKIP